MDGVGPVWNLDDLFDSADDPRLLYSLSELEQLSAVYAKEFASGTDIANGQSDEAIAEYERLMDSKARIESYARLFLLHNTNDQLEHILNRCASVDRTLRFLPRKLGTVESLPAASFGKYAWFRENCRRNRASFVSVLDEEELAARRMVAAEFHAGVEQQLNMLTIREITAELGSGDAFIRRRACIAISSRSASAATLAAEALNLSLECRQAEDEAYRFDSPEQHRHFKNQMQTEWIDTASKAVALHVDVLQSYYEMKRRLLVIDVLHDYDRNAPVSSAPAEFTYNEAREIIVAAFSAFAPEIGSAAGRFFECRWIDASSTPSDGQWDFCEPVSASAHPYIKARFDRSIGQLFVLAHELGHGVHACFMAESGHLNLAVSAVFAETVSTFAELLVFEELIRRARNLQDQLEVKIAVVERLMLNIWIQNSIFLFERELHAVYRRSGSLNANDIGKMWQRRQSLLYGDSLALTPGNETLWCYCSSVFTDEFASYAFPIGQLLSLRLHDQCQSDSGLTGAAFVAMLRAGAAVTPSETFRRVGLDIARPETWTGGIEAVRRLVAETARVSNGESRGRGSGNVGLR